MRHLKKREGENKRLSDSEDTFRKLIDGMPAGVIVYNKKREILMANNMAAEQFSCRSALEMKGTAYPEFSLSAINEYFARNPGGGFDRGRFAIIKKETDERIFLKNNIPIIFMGEEANLDSMIDITELESARTHEAKANRAKSEFLARLSFEIRTPLTGIIGMTDIISRSKLPEEIRDIVNILKKSSEDLLNIRDDILDFSKIETGNLVLEEIPFNLRDEIDYCSEKARILLAGKDIQFSCLVDENVPVSIISDPYRLRQILINLINHSVRNTAKGKISLHCSLLGSDNGHVKLVFELSDTGKTFDSEILKKIFGEVVNIESKVLTSDDESGFGPVMAGQLIRMMGGKITLESPSEPAEQSGTRIRFTLGVYSNDRKRKPLNIDAITSFDKIKTLVITGPQVNDDGILNLLHQLRLNISITTYQKSTAGQIKAGMASDDDRYNMAVILNNDDFNGFDVAESLKENDLSGRLIILMVSSQDTKGNYLKSIMMDVDHYLVMPQESEDLSKAIRESFPFIKLQGKSDAGKETKREINVLIVEDNKMNQKVLSKMLEMLGCSFEIAENGFDGFAKATNRRFDIIFMDLILPGMDGYESARKILAETPDAFIVAITADSMPASRSKAELSGIKEFISKPVRIEDLKKLLGKHFSE
jgi:signal transduction histidine kinase/CheY-like chemotaxis protein